MRLAQHKMWTRETELALDTKFYIDFHWVARLWKRRLTNGSDVKYIFPRCRPRPGTQHSFGMITWFPDEASTCHVGICDVHFQSYCSNQGSGDAPTQSTSRTQLFITKKRYKTYRIRSKQNGMHYGRMLQFCVAYFMTLSVIFKCFISHAVAIASSLNLQFTGSGIFMCSICTDIQDHSVHPHHLCISEGRLWYVASALLLALTDVDNDTSQQNVSLKWNHTETNHVAQPGKQKPYTWTSVHAAEDPRHQAGDSRYRVEFYPWTVLLASAGINRLWVFINTGVKTKYKHTSTLIRI